MRMNAKELIADARVTAPTLPPAAAKLMTDIASRLDVQYAALRESREQVQHLAAENVAARNAVQAFCDVVKSNTDVICEEVGQDGVMVILAAMKATGNMSSTDAVISDIRAEARKEGAIFAANRMLAAWDAGFVEDTPENAADIAGAILTSIEFMDEAPEGDFDRSFADEMLKAIAAQLRSQSSPSPETAAIARQFEQVKGVQS